MIAISLSPNTQGDDILLALRVLLTPWGWFRGDGVKSLENWFRRYFNTGYAIAFDSGRSAEYAILKAINLAADEEVLIQAFTCVAVPNAILWMGGKPVYVDIDDTGNIDPLDFERKITTKTRVIIVQHTLGVAANVEKIQKIAKKHKLILIEDCAHALGATLAGKKIGTFGDFAFFSFGRDKVISSVFGGMVVTKSKRNASTIRNFQRNLAMPTIHWVFTQLFHPIAFTIILPLYNVLGLGKILLVFLQGIGLLSKPFEPIEKEGKRPSFYPRRLPNAQALLALNQLKKLTSYNKKRVEIAAMYERHLKGLPITLPKASHGDIFLRYNIQVQNPDKLYQFAKMKGMLLGRWYSHVIDPRDVTLLKVGYTTGMCPNAAALASTSLNLPTYPKMDFADVRKVIETIQQYYYAKN